jgi:cobalt-zinc-cadmium efflux system membrane fusion protein
VIEKRILVGETVHAESEMFEVADLKEVCVDLNAHRHDFPLMKVGQKVLIDAGDQGKIEESVIAYLSPIGASNSQSMLVRAEIPNFDGVWKPGLFVKGIIILEESEASVTVPVTAIQTFEGKEVLFVYEKEAFEAREVTLGRRDSKKVEVLSSLKAGEQIAVQNSFVLKSDLGKSEVDSCL